MINRKLRRIALICFTCTMIGSVLWTPFRANAEESSMSEVVLVLDESGSMLKSDPERISIEASKMFLDMEKTDNSKAALVEFSNHIIATDMMEMSLENKEALKKKLDSIEYSPRAHTDTGAGLMKAVELLKGSSTDNKKAIVLFTDGKTDIDAGTENRTLEDSKADIDKAIEQAKENGILIYTIGLNSDGGVDEEELKNIAESTGGLNEIVEDVNELPEFFSDLFTTIDNIDKTKLTSSKKDGYESIPFEVTNENIMEANIEILSSQKVEDIELVNPQGNKVDYNNSEEYYLSVSDKYTLLKMTKPATGKWELLVKAAEGDTVDCSILFNYDMTFTISVDPSPDTYCFGDTVHVKAALQDQGEVVSDASFLEHMEAVATFSYDVERKVEKVTLTCEGSEFIGEYQPFSSNPFEVTVHIEGNGFYRDSNAIVLKSNGDAVKVTPEDTNQEVQTEAQDPALNQNKSGISQKAVLIIAIAVIIIIIISGVIYFAVKESRKLLRGVFSVTILDSHGGNVGIAELAENIPAKSLGKLSFHASDLMNTAVMKYKSDHNEEDVNEMETVINPIINNLKYVTIKSNGYYQILVDNKSDRIVLYSSRERKNGSNTMGVVISAGKFGLSSNVAKEFGLRIVDQEGDGFLQVCIVYKME